MCSSSPSCSSRSCSSVCSASMSRGAVGASRCPSRGRRSDDGRHRWDRPPPHPRDGLRRGAPALARVRRPRRRPDRRHQPVHLDGAELAEERGRDPAGPAHVDPGGADAGQLPGALRSPRLPAVLHQLRGRGHRGDDRQPRLLLDARLCAGQVRVRRQEAAVPAGPRHADDPGDGHAGPAVRARRQHGPGQHLLRPDPAVPGRAVRRVPHAAVLPRHPGRAHRRRTRGRRERGPHLRAGRDPARQARARDAGDPHVPGLVEQLPLAAGGRHDRGQVHAPGGPGPLQHRAEPDRLRPAPRGRGRGGRTGADRVPHPAALLRPGRRHDGHQVMGAADGPPWVLDAGGGLRAVVVDGGAPACLGTDRLELVQHAASAFEPGLLQLWVRDRAEGRSWAVLGAGSGSRAHLEVVNEGPRTRDVDIVHAHDVALAAPGALRINELYVSQYLDVTPLHGEGFGTALAVRQNLAQAGLHPWCVLAATSPVVAWATDALDVYGWSARAAAPPAGLAGDLPSRRRQHEHTLAALQTQRVQLGPGEALRTSFAGLLVDDHPRATTDDDLPQVAAALAAALAAAPWSAPGAGDRRGFAGRPADRLAPAGAYDRGSELKARPLTETELHDRWPAPWRAVERDERGGLLSFFTDDDEHVVSQAKELTTLRPHGTILRTGDTASPDARALTVTAWMTGSPLSYLTRGHASNAPLLTTVRGYLGLHRAYGLRVFVEVEQPPSAVDLDEDAQPVGAMQPEVAPDGGQQRSVRRVSTGQVGQRRAGHPRGDGQRADVRGGRVAGPQDRPVRAERAELLGLGDHVLVVVGEEGQQAAAAVALDRAPGGGPPVTQLRLGQRAGRQLAAAAACCPSSPTTTSTW